MPNYVNAFDPTMLSERVINFARLNLSFHEFVNILDLCKVEYEWNKLYAKDAEPQNVVYIPSELSKKIEIVFGENHGFLRYTTIRHIPSEPYDDHGYDVGITVSKANIVENRMDKEPELKEEDAVHPRNRAKTSR